jgi:hypothetical protein
MSELLERLAEPRVKQVLNQNIWDEFRYLIILYACTMLQPFNGTAVTFDGSQGLLRSTLRDFAQDERVSRFAFPPKLQFEFYKGANKMLEQRLENDLYYVKSFRKSNFTYYALTDQGVKVAESALAEAVKTADRYQTQSVDAGAQTVRLPRAILDKVRENLQNRVKAKEINENTFAQLIKEYEELEALTSSREVIVAQPVKIKLSRGNATIGRDQGCDHSFPDDRFMSRKHAAIEWAKGQYLITDLNSKNGTYRIESKKRINIKQEPVRVNEIYQLGTTRLIFTQ